MRNVGKFYIGIMAALVATAASAEQPSSADVNAAVCQLTDCSAKPASRAVAAAEEDDGSMVVGAQRSFSLARGPAMHAASAAPARAPIRTASAAPRSHAAAPARPAPGKADMRVAFANGSAELTDDAMVHARIYAEALKSDRLAGVRFEIAGHTNSVGGSDANKLLSQRRAQAVVDYLISQGVSSERLKAAGFGAERPLDGHDASEAVNRRVEIVRVG